MTGKRRQRATFRHGFGGPDGQPYRLPVVGAIGVGQIFAWGSSYYLIAVLATPVVADTGWPTAWVVGGLSLAFLVSGSVSPQVGRLIEERGGRPVLAASAVVLAAGLLLMALAPNVAAFVVAWLVIGAGMGGGLYDPAFSALGRLYGAEARGAIAQVTLIAGFASTICWPLSALLIERLGWRGTCLTYAAIDLAFVLPLYLAVLPDEPRRRATPAAQAAAASAGHGTSHGIAFVLLAASLTLASVVMTVISVHLLTMLQARGMTLASAVALGALIGPSQVGARVVEIALVGRYHPIWTMLASTLLVVAGLALLHGPVAAIGAGLILYGAGSGIRSIARGTVPLAMFGATGYATLMGRLVVPTLIAQAAAPTLGALLLEHAGATAGVTIITALAALNAVPVVMLLTFAVGKQAMNPPAPHEEALR